MTMLPRLQSSESLLTATRTAVGTGSTKDGRTIQHAWAREAAGPAVSVSQKPSAASLDRLAASGYGIRKVPAKAPQAPAEA